MAIKYLNRAKKDFQKIIDYRVANYLPNPVGFTQALRAKVLHLYTINHPGGPGLKPGTLQWSLHPQPFFAVFKKAGNNVKIYRVLHNKQKWP